MFVFLKFFEGLKPTIKLGEFGLLKLYFFQVLLFLFSNYQIVDP